MQPINVRRPACLLRPERRAIAISLFLGLTVGALDALWDWAFFYKKESFLDVLFFDVTPFEIYIRTLILASFVSFGMIMSRELSKRARVEQSLRREKAFTDNILNDLGANCYITKPVSLEEFAKVVRTVEDFWFTIVKLPPRAGEGRPWAAG
jgi:hypothetical protein